MPREWKCAHKYTNWVFCSVLPPIPFYQPNLRDPQLCWRQLFVGVHLVPFSVSSEENVVQDSAFKHEQPECFTTFNAVLSFSDFVCIHALKITSFRPQMVVNGTVLLTSWLELRTFISVFWCPQIYLDTRHPAAQNTYLGTK